MGINRVRVRDHLSKLLDLACREGSGSRGRLVIYDAEGRALLDQGWPTEDEAFRLRSAGTIRRAVEEKRPLLASSKRPPSPGEALTEEADGESLLCLPFLLNLRPVGAFCLGREAGRDPFTSDDIETLHFLCVPILAVVREHIIDGLGPQDGGGSTNGDPIIGRGPAAVAIRAFIAKVKDSTAPVFIYGESGTGKELIAKAIHERGAGERARLWP